MEALRRELRGIYIIWLRDVKRLLRDKPRIIGSIVQPTLYLFILGVGLQNAFRGGGSAAFGSAGGFSFVSYLFPGIIGMSILFTSIFSAMSIIWDREFGFLKEIMVAPISRSSVALGKVLGGSTAAVIQGGILLIYAPLLGVRLGLVQLLEVVLVMMLLAFALTSIGVVIAARMKSMEGFQVIMNFLLMPMLFLSGAFFPLQGLPTWLTYLVRIDSLAYGIDALRAIILGNIDIKGPGGAVVFKIPAYPLWQDFGIILALGLIMVSVGVWLFNKQD